MPHTAAKHQILRKYLGAWFPKLAWTGRVVFIDGFAGPGEYSGGEPGSPLIALDVASKHKGDLSKCDMIFIFVEKDEARFAHLSALLEETALPDYLGGKQSMGSSRIISDGCWTQLKNRARILRHPS